MPPSRSSKAPRLSMGDRLVSALVGATLGFGTMLVVWFLVLEMGGRSGTDVAMPFSWTIIVAGVVALISFAAGPERMMDGFEMVWSVLSLRWLEEPARGIHRDRRF